MSRPRPRVEVGRSGRGRVSRPTPGGGGRLGGLVRGYAGPHLGGGVFRSRGVYPSMH